MNLRDLQYLIALAKHRHFGKAAQACFVSQPALSMQIKKLEASLGVQLLERTSKQVLITEAGLAIATRAQAILNQTEELHEVARLSADPRRSKLKLGIIPTLAPYLLPHIIPELATTFPELQLYLTEEQTVFLLKKLRNGELDAVIVSTPVLEPDFIVSPLFKEEFFVATSHSHRFANCQAIKLADFKNEPLLLLEEGHCLREQAFALCHQANAKTQNFWATSLETLRHMVAIGVGITLMPKLACKTNDGVCYIPFIDHHSKFSRSIAIVWRASTAKENLLNDIASDIKQIMTNKLASMKK